MQAVDLCAFSEMLQQVMNYYRRDCTDGLIDLYWEGLQCYELESIKLAIGVHMKDPEEGKFEPRISSIVKIIEGSKSDRAVWAWSFAQEAASSVGAYQDVIFEDPVIHAVIEDMGGWPIFCRLNEKDLSYHQHRFAVAYRSHASSQAVSGLVYPALLSGDRRADDWRSSRGLPPVHPTLIGDRQICAQVYANGSSSGRLQISSNTSASQLAMLALPTRPTPAGQPGRSLPMKTAKALR